MYNFARAQDKTFIYTTQVFGLASKQHHEDPQWEENSFSCQDTALFWKDDIIVPMLVRFNLTILDVMHFLILILGISFTYQVWSTTIMSHEAEPIKIYKYKHIANQNIFLMWWNDTIFLENPVFMFSAYYLEQVTNWFVVIWSSEWVRQFPTVVPL